MPKRLAMSGMVIAIYIVMIGVFQSVSFGAIQIRLANSLYALCVIYPFLVIPMGVAVILSNLIFGGLGIIDIVCGSAVTIITCFIISKLKNRLLIPIPMIFVVGLLIPIYLSMLLKIPYMALMPTVLIGQIIPAILGTVLVKRLG